MIRSPLCLYVSRVPLHALKKHGSRHVFQGLHFAFSTLSTYRQAARLGWNGGAAPPTVTHACVGTRELGQKNNTRVGVGTAGMRAVSGRQHPHPGRPTNLLLCFEQDVQIEAIPVSAGCFDFSSHRFHFPKFSHECPWFVPFPLIEQEVADVHSEGDPGGGFHSADESANGPIVLLLESEPKLLGVHVPGDVRRDSLVGVVKQLLVRSCVVLGQGSALSSDTSMKLFSLYHKNYKNAMYHE